MLEHRNNEMGRKAIPSTWLSESEPPGLNPCITDADGVWSLNNVPRGDKIQVRLKLTHQKYISDPEWGRYQQRQMVKMAQLRTGTATLVMDGGITLSGSLSTEDGQAVSDAVIVWGNDPYLQTGSQEVRAHAEGTYQMDPLPPEPIRVTVVAPGWAPQTRVVDLGQSTRNGDFQLLPGKTLRIRFVDSEGKPIPEVFVGIRRWRDTEALYNHKHPNVLDTRIPRRANADGLYEWTWAPSDVVLYSFGAKGYRESERGLIADGKEYTIELEREEAGGRN